MNGKIGGKIERNKKRKRWKEDKGKKGIKLKGGGSEVNLNMKGIDLEIEKDRSEGKIKINKEWF